MSRIVTSCLFLVVAACNDSAISGVVDMASPDLSMASDLSPVCSASNCAAAGQACVKNQCITDCRQTNAVPCSMGQICDFTAGTCAAIGSPGILTGPFVDCTDSTGATTHCGPGATCSLEGQCVADGPCSTLTCDDMGRCYGTSCPVNRPSPVCTLPTVDQLAAISATAASFSFDALCTTYVNTLQSGQDFVYQLTSAGIKTAYAGIGINNLHEVTAAPLSAGATQPGEVAALYASGGAGVSILNRSGASPLPLSVSTNAVTVGTAPLGGGFDGYAAGLTYGPGGRLFVANAKTSGDLVQLDTKAMSFTNLYTAPNNERITAVTQYNERTLAIGMTGGTVRLFDVGTKTATDLAKVSDAISSLAMDRFTGTLYVGLMKGNIVTVSSSGTVTAFQTKTLPPYLRVGPDNNLYCLTFKLGGSGSSGPVFVNYPLAQSR